MKIGCVVLTSGDSARFGENKLMADFQGKPLLRHTLEKLPKALRPVWVVTRSEEVEALALEMGFDALLHRQPDISDTIRLGLEKMEDVEGCLFCVGDQPLLSQETLLRQMEAFSREPRKIARVCYDGRDGNPALFPWDFFEELKRLKPGQSGGAVMQRHPDAVVRVQATHEWELMDVDTPQALEELERLANQMK